MSDAAKFRVVYADSDNPEKHVLSRPLSAETAISLYEVFDHAIEIVKIVKRKKANA